MSTNMKNKAMAFRLELFNTFQASRKRILRKVKQVVEETIFSMARKESPGDQDRDSRLDLRC